MSLDNTSHPGRSGHDELVPSRYALRVGEIDVLVVSAHSSTSGGRNMSFSQAARTAGSALWPTSRLAAIAPHR